MGIIEVKIMCRPLEANKRDPSGSSDPTLKNIAPRKESRSVLNTVV